MMKTFSAMGASLIDNVQLRNSVLYLGRKPHVLNSEKSSFLLSIGDGPQDTAKATQQTCSET